MTEIETAIIAGTFAIVGVVAGYLFQDRQATKQVRLRPLEDRQNALKEVYGTMTTYFYAIHEAVGNLPKNPVEYKEAVGSHAMNFELAIRRNGIWISKVQESVLNARSAFIRAGLAISPMTRGSQGAGSGQVDFKELSDTFGGASRAIARELGIPVLEEDLDQIIRGSIDVESNKLKKSLPWRVWGKAKYGVLSLGNLLVLYLSSLLTARSDFPLIDVVFFGAGLGVALAILISRRQWIRHYVTIVAWLGVTLGGIVSGVFQRLALTIASLVGSDWVLLPLLGVLVVNNALLLRLIDYTREFGKSLKA